MKDAAAETAKKTVQKTLVAKDNKETALDRRYGAIGISAVAAAARYQGPTKNQAYAPVANAWYEPAEEAA